MKRILVLDRDPLVRRALLRSLSLDDHEVVTAETVQQALGYIVDDLVTFHYAVVDFDATDSFRLIDEMDRVRPTPRLVLLSAYPEKAGAARDLGILLDKMDLGKVREMIA